MVEPKQKLELDRPSQLPVQKLAIVLQVASTGGWRYLLRLVEGMRGRRPQLQITVYLGWPVLATFAEDQPRESLQKLGINVAAWPDLPEPPPQRKFRPIRRWKYKRAQRAYQLWLRHFDNYDVVFFAWPYWLECPDTSARLFFIPHDFNYLHFMGAFNMAPSDAARQKSLHAQWLQRGVPIVSTQFIADELLRGFPKEQSKPRVIPLARLSNQSRLEDAVARELVTELGIDNDYILSVNNTAYHKNIGQVLTAYHYVRQRYPELKLVLVGHNTQGASGTMRTPWYVDVADESMGDKSACQVISLGMRSDREVAALIQRARVVINASLYEAGNGSGLDAWALGTPVAMSDIPAFQEHLSTLGVQAELFHPRCCFSIGDAICRVLDDPERAQAMAAESRLAMGRYDWSQVADQYLQVFETASK